jgi:small nuclear ribonucleoprotein (snRNP)-like protein
MKEMTGIYTDPSLVQLVYALAGHEIVVKTTDQKIFKGVLEGVSPAVS